MARGSRCRYCTLGFNSLIKNNAYNRSGELQPPEHWLHGSFELGHGLGEAFLDSRPFRLG